MIAWSVAGAERTPALLIGMALVGISYGALQNLTLGVAFEAVPRRDQVVASAVWNIGFDAGTGLGAVVVGALASAFAFPPALLVAAALSLLTLPLAFLGLRDRRNPKVPHRGVTLRLVTFDSSLNAFHLRGPWPLRSTTGGVRWSLSEGGGAVGDETD